MALLQLRIDHSSSQGCSAFNVMAAVALPRPHAKKADGKKVSPPVIAPPGPTTRLPARLSALHPLLTGVRNKLLLLAVVSSG